MEEVTTDIVGHQIPNPKHQIPNTLRAKFQIPMTKTKAPSSMGIYENSPPHTEESVSESEDADLNFLHFLRLGHLVIGIWCLFGIWCLELGA